MGGWMAGELFGWVIGFMCDWVDNWWEGCVIGRMGAWMEIFVA